MKEKKKRNSYKPYISWKQDFHKAYFPVIAQDLRKAIQEGRHLIC